MSYQRRLTQKDINYGELVGAISTEKRIEFTNNKNINDEPGIVIKHRRFMEKLKKEYDYNSDNDAWKDTNKFLHTFDVNKY